MQIEEQTARLELPADELAPAEDVDGNTHPSVERHLFADSDATPRIQ